MGYLFDTAKAEQANSIQDDIKMWYSQLASSEVERQAIVSSVLASATNVWVKLYCAGLVRQSDPALARATLKELEQIVGPVAVLAQAWREAYLPEH